jgi:prepilin signal peptidase PulO-like enzyme (type II secretory pathway)
MGEYLSRLKSGIALAAVATAFALVAFGFLAFAVYFALLDVTRPAVAAGVTGAVASAVAAIAFLVARAAVHGHFGHHGKTAHAPEPAPAPSGGAGDRELAAQIGQLLGAQASGWTRTHPFGAMGIALAAGFAVGMSPELRRTLRGLMG